MFDDIDWQAPRPDAAAFAAGWERTRITSVVSLDERLFAVTRSLDSTNLDGGGRVAQFIVDLDPAVAWFMLRNRLNEIDFFTRFFAHSTVLAALPEAADRLPSVEQFAPENRFVAHGCLCSAIATGGAYERFEKPDEDALTLALDFARAAFGAQFRGGVAWINNRAWSRWFKDIAWDQSFFWFDVKTRVVTVLLITDSD